MSEKRFKLAYEKGNEAIFEDLDHPYPRRMTNKEVERKLNEQEATISALKEENIELKKLRKYCAEWMGVKEENLYDVVR